MMDYLGLLLPFLFAGAIVILRKYFATLWKHIQLPLTIVLSILSVFVVSIMLYAAYVMVGRAIFSVGEKAIYCLLIAGLIGFFVWLNITNWTKLRAERGSRE